MRAEAWVREQSMRLVRWAFVATLFLSVAQAREPVVGGPCEGCEAVFEGQPRALSSEGRIAPADEPGERMRVTGQVWGADGKPRANVIVYAYQTNAAGIYPRPARSSSPAADRHGRLRGWALSDAQGRYAFETIRPASYPSTNIPAHIHMHVIEPGCATYYIDDIVFTDDERLTAAARSGHERGRGGPGVVTPIRRGSGPWLVVRDIRLSLNVPDYRACGSR
jgi:protocatechuate 3,4-dioxygenase beta subunit